MRRVSCRMGPVIQLVREALPSRLHKLLLASRCVLSRLIKPRCALGNELCRHNVNYLESNTFTV